MVYTYTDFTGGVRRLVIGSGLVQRRLRDVRGRNVRRALLVRRDPRGDAPCVRHSARQLARTALAMAPFISLGVAPRDRSPINIAQKLRDAGVMNLGRFARITVTFNPVSLADGGLAHPALALVYLALRRRGLS
jgi:hypothetical protein